MTDDNRQFVARDAAVAVKRAGLSGELSPDGERTAGELAAFLEVADQGYAICICNSPQVRERILEGIRERLAVRRIGMCVLSLAAGELSVTAAIRRVLKTPEFAAMERTSSHVAVSVENLTDVATSEEWNSGARPAAIQGLNRQRDWMRKLGRPVLFWIDEWLAAKLPLLAPDFWVGRSVVFEFRTESEFRDSAMTWIGEERIGFTSPDEARRKARIYEELARDEKRPEQRALHLAALGALLVNMADYARAEDVLKQALAIAETAQPDGAVLATALNNLAALYQATNRLSEAEPLMRRALAIDEKSYGPEHPEVATDLNNLAQLFKATNRLAEAEPLMVRALAIDEKSYGPEHPEVARDLNNLAALLQDTNRLAEAEPLMKRVVTIFEKAYGVEHPNVATALNNLAQLYQDTNRLSEAEPLMERALSIDEKSYGPEHPDVARDLNNLAQLYQDTNRLAEAEPLMKRVMQITFRFRAATGHEHPKERQRIGNYGGLLKAMGRSDGAIRKTLAELASQYGPKLERPKSS